MKAESVWKGTGKASQFPALSGDLQVDVVIVGGGITGMTAAMLLSEAGKSVALLEAHDLAHGTTGHSTGNLYAPAGFSKILSKWDEQTARAVAESRQSTVDFIESVIRDKQIDCNFHRRTLHLFATTEKSAPMIEQEAKAMQTAGLSAELVDDLPLPLPVTKVARLQNQAQFQPLNYVRGLAERISSPKCQIFENSEALRIDDEKGLVETAQGRVHAERIILATHTPKGIDVTQMEMEVLREHGIAARLKGDDYPEGIFWDVDSGYSTRSYVENGARYLLLIGGKYKVGHEEDTGKYFEAMEAFLRQHYPVDSIEYRWGAQQYEPADQLPYIGQSAGAPSVYIATGFQADGLIYGSLAARIISDLILGRENPWADLYKATRFTPLKSAKEAFKENVDVALHLAKDFIKDGAPGGLDALKPGEGRLLEINDEKIAAYRDEHDQVHTVSPVCTHMGCIVHWNAAEKSWDCPCHGSRFHNSGEVIEGPALTALERKPV